jgi:DNA polymerase III subunit delta'
MKFRDVIGQQEVKQHLKDMVSHGKISHALLFYGSSGIGKLPLAIAFAQYLSCENHIDGDSCGVCYSCIKFEKLIHPDLHFVFPVVKGGSNKAISDSFIQQWREQIIKNPYFSINEWLSFIGSENKQGSIYSEESGEIIKKLNLKTFESDYKVMIIWLPEKMNNACGNKLLKMLEEPPEKTVFILVSDNREEVLQTILSRTQPLKVPSIDKSDLLSALEKKYPEIDNKSLQDICKLSRGSYLDAKNHIQASDEIKYNFEKFVEIMRFCYSRKIKETISWAIEISKIGREKQKSLLNYSLRFLRENFILNYKNDQISYITSMEKDFANKFSPFINENNIFSLVEEFEKAHYHIERNANPKILLTDLVFKIMKLLR